MSIYLKSLGTQEVSYQIGLGATGVKLTNNAGALEIRNPAGAFVVTRGANGVTTNDYVTFQQLPAAVPTVTTAFTIPAANGVVVVNVSSGSSFAGKQIVELASGGVFFGIFAVSAQTATTVTLFNLGIEGNLTAGTVPVGTPVLVTTTPNDVAVTSLTALGVLYSNAFRDGMRVTSLDVLDTFVLQLTSTVASDAITAITASGGGTWVRQLVPSLFWQKQTAWFIGGAGAADTNTGATTGAPLATFDELRRRTMAPGGGRWYITSPTTVTVQANITTSYLDLEIDCLNPAGGNSLFTLTTNLPATATTTVTAVTAASPSGNTVQSVTFATAPAVGAILQDTTSGSYFIGTSLPNAGILHTTPNTSSLATGGTAALPPAVGDTIATLGLATVQVKRLICHGAGTGVGGGFAQQINFTQAEQGVMPAIEGFILGACNVPVAVQACSMPACNFSGVLNDYVAPAGNFGFGVFNGSFLQGCVLAMRNSKNSTCLVQNCVIGGGGAVIQAQGSFVTYVSTSFDGAIPVLRLYDTARALLSGANAWYGSAANTVIQLYPGAQVTKTSNTTSCTIAVANSLSFALGTGIGAPTLGAFTPLLTNGAVVPAAPGASNWASGTSGIGAVPYSGGGFHTATFATVSA